MQLKNEPLQSQDPDILVEEFIELLESKNLVSSMTGNIFSSPVHIKGSSLPEERGFIENAINANGKNPFTNEKMTLDELNLLEDDQSILTEIRTLKEEFLKANEQHSALEEIKILLSARIYKHEPIQIITGYRAPMDPSPDDILAMQAAGGNQYAFFQPANGISQLSSSELAHVFAAIPSTVTTLDLSSNSLSQLSASELTQAFAAIPNNLLAPLPGSDENEDQEASSQVNFCSLM